VKKIYALALLSCLAAAAAVAEPTQDWPQFRGLEQTGRAAPGLFDDEFGLEVEWKRELGSGYASVLVVGERGVTAYTDGESDFVIAFDVETGDELWRYRIAEMYKGHSGSDDGPISTPVIHDGKVFGFGPRGDLFALALDDGRELWAHRLDGETESRAPFYGHSTTPIWVDGVLVVATGGPDGRSISAFDPANGELRWSWGDDVVSYQNPIVMELLGHRQVVAFTDFHFVGLEPATGEELWRHQYWDSPRDTSGQPVPFGDDRFLMPYNHETGAYRLVRSDGGYELEELWRGDVLRATYAIPVIHDGYAYGFTRNFLTCLDPATGEVEWKSRPPGGLGVIVVDGHLVVLNPDGELVVIEASPEEYRERARLPVLGAGSYTPASYAGGRIFVRNLEELASVRITETARPELIAAAERERPELEGEFGAFVAEVEAAPEAERAARLDTYLDGRELPIVEDGGRVHFLYRGEVEDVALGGSFLGFGEEEILFPVEGTDLYFRSYRLDPAGIYEYRFNVDFGNVVADPANPLAIGSRFGPSSELRMPGFEGGEYVYSEPPPERQGEVDKFEFWSEILGNARAVEVYKPAGFSHEREARYPLVLINGGDQGLELAAYDRVLDNLLGERVEPAVVVFMPRTQRDFGGEATADYARMLAEELIPHLERHYHTAKESSQRTIMGPGSGGFAALFAALETPGVYGHVAVQSFYDAFQVSEEFWSKVGEGPVPEDLEIWVEQSPDDYQIGQIDSVADTKRLIEALRERDFDLEVDVVKGPSTWGRWRARLGEILEAFHPPAPPSEATGP